MAKDCSFDVVSDVDMQEVDNAINQTVKEINQRFDFRGSKAEVKQEEDVIKLVADSDYKLQSIIDILHAKAVKRGISLKCFEYGKIEAGSHGTVRQTVTIKKGISKEKAKEVITTLKDSKLKVQAQIMDDQVRVSGKDKDELQKAIMKLKQSDFNIDLQFINFRS